MRDGLDVMHRAKLSPPRFWPKEARHAGTLPNSMAATTVAVRSAPFAEVSALGQAVRGEVEGVVGLTLFEGRVIELEYDDEPENGPPSVAAVVLELFELPSGPTWISTWGPDRWPTDFGREPAVGDEVSVRIGWESPVAGDPSERREVRDWRPFRPDPWDAELVAKAEMAAVSGEQATRDEDP